MNSNERQLADIQGWLSSSPASHVADCSRAWLLMLAKAGRIRAVQLADGRWLYDPNDLARLKEERANRKNSF